MGLYLRHADVRRLEQTLDTCLAPLTFESADAWRVAVEYETRELLQGDHVVFAIPLGGSVDVHATNVTPNAVQAMGHLFARVPDIPADPFLNAVEAQRVAHGLEVWSRVGAYLQAVRGSRRARSCAFLGEVLAPSLMRDSENIDFTLRDGHTALCVSFEHGDERRRGGAGAARTAARSLLRVLVPALKTGVDSLVRYQAQTSAFTRWIEASGDAVALVDRAGRTVLRNPALQRLLDTEPDVRQVDRAIDRAQRSLRQAHGVLGSRRGPSRDADLLEPCVVVRTARRTYRVAALHAPATVGEPLVMVTVQPVGTPTTPNDSLSITALRTRWGLTAREAEIAVRLARRATNPEIAAELGVSPHTVRHHVERVFLKLDVRSRRDIARRLTSARRDGERSSPA